VNRRGVWPVVVFGAVVATSSVAPPSGADDGGTFSAAASSSGLRVSLAAPGYAAVQELTDFGFPVAQAAVDSLGESSGFASYPYPGSTFLAGPGTLAGFTGQGLPPFFTYPFIASSSYPGQPETKVAQPGYQLTSTSGASSSQATAEAGGSDHHDSSLGFSAASARAQRSTDDGTVTADGANRTDAVALAGVLRIGHAAGSAKVTRTGGGVLTRDSSFAVEGLSVAGQRVGLAPDGLVVPGTTVPVPNGRALTDALARAGLALRYLRGGDLPDGVVSPGMAVTWNQQIPNGPMLVMTLTFGQVVARASAEAGAPVAADLPAPTGETATFPGTGTAVGSPTEAVPDGAVPVATVPEVSPSTAGAPPATSSQPLPVDSPAAAPAAPPTDRMAVLAPAARADRLVLEPTVNTFYSVLVFAALAGVLATVVLRRAGN